MFLHQTLQHYMFCFFLSFFLQNMYPISVSLLCTFLLASHLSFTVSLSDGMSLELIHRDSPHSPLYRPNVSDLQSFHRDVESTQIRATTHLTHLQYSLSFRDPIFTLDASIGTPKTKITLAFDTMSPFTWTQCKPCKNCFKQYHPLFDRSKSTSFKKFYQNHDLAKHFNCTVQECYYFVNTRARQSSSGTVSTETFNFPGLLRPMAGLIFGCGTINQWAPMRTGMGPTGVLGMGDFPTSFPRQLANGARFSYCLSGKKKKSLLKFGEKAVISGSKVQTTTLVRGPQAGKSLKGSGYRLKMIGISVAGKRLDILTGAFDGGCIVDTGSPFSVLDLRAYRVVSNAISSYLAQFKSVKKIVNKKYPNNLCYKYPKGFKSFPGMTWHFEGAKLDVNGKNLFMFGKEDLISNFACLQMLGGAEANHLGVDQQQDVKFLYDLDAGQLSFVKESC